MSWIDDFMDYTDQLPVPRIHRLWSGITCLAGCMERRIWAKTSGGHMCANLYTLLVGPAGVGKSISMKPVRSIWRMLDEAPDTPHRVHIAPNNTTKAALIDALSRAQIAIAAPGYALFEYHALNVCASEFSVFCPAYDAEFLNTLNDLYDCDAKFSEQRRYFNKGKPLDISYPFFNLLAGATPQWLGSFMPDVAWGSGTTSRIIMVYAESAPEKSYFDFGPKRELADLLPPLKSLMDVVGEAQFTGDAKAFFGERQASGFAPVPTHSKLESYRARRPLHLLKLSLIAAAASSHPLTIGLADITQAWNWMLEVEGEMSNLFKALISRSDKIVIDDLHQYMWGLYAQERKPIHQSKIYQWLLSKVPSERAPRLVENMINSQRIKRDPHNPDCFIPMQPKMHYGSE